MLHHVGREDQVERGRVVQLVYPLGVASRKRDFGASGPPGDLGTEVGGDQPAYVLGQQRALEAIPGAQLQAMRKGVLRTAAKNQLDFATPQAAQVGLPVCLYLQSGFFASRVANALTTASQCLRVRACELVDTSVYHAGTALPNYIAGYLWRLPPRLDNRY